MCIRKLYKARAGEGRRQKLTEGEILRTVYILTIQNEKILNIAQAESSEGYCLRVRPKSRL